jgi:iron complex transport system substrate-binding protein
LPASALLLAASIASLNLCADEYLLLLARPGEIASVSYLSKDPLESPLWARAQGVHANRGSLEQVLRQRPDAVLTMGGGGRSTALIARRLGIRAIDLSLPDSLQDVASNLRKVAAALGEPARANPLIGRMQQLVVAAPARKRDAIFLGTNGDSLSADGLGARWMQLAGLRQRPLGGDRASLETLLLKPPEVLLQSDYRRTQPSAGTRWLRHPIVRRAPSRRVRTDGRAWTCMGPLLIGEVQRLRTQLR